MQYFSVHQFLQHSLTRLCGVLAFTHFYYTVLLAYVVFKCFTCLFVFPLFSTKKPTPKDLPINARHVHDDINHITAQLIALHVHWGTVCGDVDLAHHIKQECFLYPRILKQNQHTANHRMLKLKASRVCTDGDQQNSRLLLDSFETR